MPAPKLTEAQEAKLRVWYAANAEDIREQISEWASDGAQRVLDDDAPDTDTDDALLDAHMDLIATAEDLLVSMLFGTDDYPDHVKVQP